MTRDAGDVPENVYDRVPLVRSARHHSWPTILFPAWRRPDPPGWSNTRATVLLAVAERRRSPGACSSRRDVLEQEKCANRGPGTTLGHMALSSSFGSWSSVCNIDRAASVHSGEDGSAGPSRKPNYLYQRAFEVRAAAFFFLEQITGAYIKT